MTEKIKCNSDGIISVGDENTEQEMISKFKSEWNKFKNKYKNILYNKYELTDIEISNWEKGHSFTMYNLMNQVMKQDFSKTGLTEEYLNLF